MWTKVYEVCLQLGIVAVGVAVMIGCKEDPPPSHLPKPTPTYRIEVGTATPVKAKSFSTGYHNGVLYYTTIDGKSCTVSDNYRVYEE